MSFHCSFQQANNNNITIVWCYDCLQSGNNQSINLHLYQATRAHSS